MSDRQRKKIAIFGFSIAGVAAALELKSNGCSVYLFESVTELPIRSFYVITPTPINSKALNAEEFDVLASRLLNEAGVELRTLQSFKDISEENDKTQTLRLKVVDFSDHVATLDFHSAIFAPTGKAKLAHEDLGVGHLVGYSVCYCAWSDAKCFSGMPVVVIGGGNLALEQALLLAKHASRVVIVCEQPSFKASDVLLQKVTAESKITLCLNASIESISHDAERRITGINLVSQEMRTFLNVSAVFIAVGLETDWTLWGGEQSAKLLVTQGKLFPCGMAVGIDYFDHAALFADGVRAAQECLKTHRSDDDV